MQHKTAQRTTEHTPEHKPQHRPDTEQTQYPDTDRTQNNLSTEQTENNAQPQHRTTHLYTLYSQI